MKELYDYYLHYNPYTGLWNAVKRDKSNEYLNGMLTSKEVKSDKDLNVLINLIKKQ